MGMYPAYREIPAAVLEQLLVHPADAVVNDALLFVQGANCYEWSEVASTCTLPEEVLANRFATAVLPVPREQWRVLRGLELGKYPDWETGIAFAHFLAIAPEFDGDLSPALEPDLDYEVELDRWQAIAPELTKVNGAGPIRSEMIGFATDLVCYGINGFRTAEELSSVWAKAVVGLSRFPAHRERLLSRFADELHYYQGCALRGSADLSYVA